MCMHVGMSACSNTSRIIYRIKSESSLYGQGNISLSLTHCICVPAYSESSSSAFAHSSSIPTNTYTYWTHTHTDEQNVVRNSISDWIPAKWCEYLQWLIYWYMRRATHRAQHPSTSCDAALSRFTCLLFVRLYVCSYAAFIGVDKAFVYHTHMDMRWYFGVAARTTSFVLCGHIFDDIFQID